MAEPGVVARGIFKTIHAGLTIDIPGARPAPKMHHLYVSSRDKDLAIAQRRHIVTVEHKLNGPG